MNELAKVLILAGLLMLVLGVALIVSPKIPIVGRLPGDFLIRRDNFTFYFPLATSIILSIILTIIINFFLRK